MLDGIVEAIVDRIAPLLVNAGESVCSSTPGLITRWEAYEFMCRNVQNLGVLMVEHIIVTLLAMAIAILLGVLIGVRVSSAPWPERGSVTYWPVVGLGALFFVAGIVMLISGTGEVEAVEAMEGVNVSNVGTWRRLFEIEGIGAMSATLALVQAVAMMALGAVVIGGMLGDGFDWRVIGSAVVGALVGPLFIPRPILHSLFSWLYSLLELLPLGDFLGVIADALNWARDAAPLWALLLFIILFMRMPKRFTWQTLAAAFFGGYALAVFLSLFVITPWTETTNGVIQLLLFGVLALVIVMGENAADSTLYIVGVIFTIPSLAMFGIMIPIIGIGVDPAVVALVLYGLLPILRNTITGMWELDPAYSEAGRGMGMTDLQLLTQVKLPLALPVILAGVRVSTVMTVGLASIATLIGAGGLGELIFQGINRTNAKMVLTGAIWISILALLFDYIFGQGEVRWVSKGIRPDAGESTVQEVQEAAGV